MPFEGTEQLHRLAHARVACVGDVMLDRFVYGEVDRVSPEAPVPVMQVQDEAAMLGGVGNVARNLAALGAEPWVAAVVGDDAVAREVEGLVDELGGEARLVQEAGRRTTTKARCVSDGQQLVRVDRESRDGISADSEDAIAAWAESALEACSVLVLSDYAKGVLTERLARRLIEMAREKKRPVIVDPKAKEYAQYAGASLVTPNGRELARATGVDRDDDGALIDAVGRFAGEHGVPSVLVTRGRRGMLLWEGGETRDFPAEAREVYDVSGAGDTAVATVAAATAAGWPLAEAVALANVAAGIAVGKVGTATVRRDELARALRTRALEHTEAKVVSADEAVEAAERWRRDGLTVGFTNGCFDLLHPGHLKLIGEARRTCDRLVVGLNSDASVRRLKGERRPVQDETARSAVLASLGSVDRVVLFDDDTPYALIERLRPDVLIKGGDYTPDTVVGADVVQRYGGRLHLVALEEGHSTTELLARQSE